MVIEIVLLIIGLIIGFFIAHWIISQQKWSDKAKVINVQWEKKVKELEKNYEVKLEKSKTEIEKNTKEWQVKYIRDIEELKRLFKESEKRIREKSVSSSRRTLVGKFIERFVPFLSGIKYSASDMHFLGQPVDYVIFDGLRDDNVKKVVFLEVKTGDSQLTKREKSLKEAIKQKKVFWEESIIKTESKKKPDKEISNDEESIKGLYDDIDNKIGTIKKRINSKWEIDETDEEESDYDVGDTFTCPYCDKNFVLDSKEQREYEEKGKIEVECPHCGKIAVIN